MSLFHMQSEAHDATTIATWNRHIMVSLGFSVPNEVITDESGALLNGVSEALKGITARFTYANLWETSTPPN